MIQILGLRPGRVFADKGWFAPSIQALYKEPFKYLEQVPSKERFNLHYVTSHRSDGVFLYQDCVLFDIDKIEVERVSEYIPVICNVFGLDASKTGFMMSGHGLHIVVEVPDKFLSEQEITDARNFYCGACELLAEALDVAGLKGLVDNAPMTNNKMMRYPSTTNIKPDYDPVESYVIQGNIEMQPLDLFLLFSKNGGYATEGQYLASKVLRQIQIDPLAVVEGCEFLKWCSAAQEEVNEPQWVAMLTVIGRLDATFELAHKYSEGHNGYTFEATERKVKYACSEKYGPRTCSNISSLWEGCGTCKHLGKVTSPITIKSEDFIQTEHSGFHQMKLDKYGNATSGRPCPEDLMKFFARKHIFVNVNGISQTVWIYNGKYWDQCSSQKLNEFATDHYSPVANKGMRTEFLDLIYSRNVKDNTFLNPVHMINFQNGVLNLKTREFVDHSPDYGFTNIIGFDYNPKAVCPRFDLFLEEVTCGDRELENNLVEFVAYSISGLPPAWGEKCLFLVGEGSNGKSVFIDTIRKVVGDKNTAALSLDDLKNPNARADLFNKMINLSDETPTHSLMESSIFKNMITGGNVQIKRLYKDQSSMACITKFIFACNKLPLLTDFSEGLKRRLLIVPFNASFTDINKDRDLREKLALERAGILNKFLDGYSSLVARGRFPFSAAVEASLKNYMELNTHLGEWFEDCCIRDAHSKVPSQEVFASYSQWCTENRVSYRDIYSSMEFGRQLLRLHTTIKNARPYINGRQIRGYEGIRLTASRGTF